MSEYKVSALKYRPQNFDTVIGQEHITRTLKNALQNDHLAHSFLFTGPRGVGKTSTARILAKVINCENLTENAVPCDSCASCEAFNNNTSYNVYELDAASNNSVEDIRQLIEGVRFAPQRGRYKVYIIDEVHMLSNQAFNAFLKTLEEPPSHAIFILATTEKHKIIPTILSRCQIFDFKRIQTEDALKHLSSICEEEGISYDEDSLQLIAQKSEGCMRDALSLMDKLTSFNQGKLEYDDVLQNLNILDYDYFFQIAKLFDDNDSSGLLMLLDDILSKGFEENILVEGLLQHYRNLLVAQNPASTSLLNTIDSVKNRYLESAQNTSIDFILTAMQILNDLLLSLKESGNKRLLTETKFLKLAFLNQLLESDNAEVSSKTENFLIPRARKFRPFHKVSSSRLKVDDDIIQQKKSEASALEEKKETAENDPKDQLEDPKSTYSKNGDSNESPKKISIPISLQRLKADKAKARSKNKLDETLKNKKELTQENIDACWENYLEKHKLKDEGINYRYLSALQILENSEDEVRVVAPSKSALASFIDPNRQQQILEHFRSYLSLPYIKFSTEIDRSRAPKTENKKDKYEIFEEMQTKNPHLAELKKIMGLEPY